MSGCGADPEPPAPSASQAPAPVENAPREPAAESEPTSRRAETALRAQRLFAPAGDNAFELFVQAVAEQPADERARTALQDLVPYAVLHIEQRLAARDRAQATRVLDLLERAQPEAPSLPRLQRALLALAVEAPVQPATIAAAPEAPNGVATTASVLPTAPATPALQAGATEFGDESAGIREPGASPDTAGLPAATAAAPAIESAPAPSAAIATAAPVQAASVQAAASTPPAAMTDQLPRLLRQVAPKYPPAAGRRRQEGQVEVAFTINADGRVSDVQVISSNPPRVFDRAAIAAMEDWRYEAPGRSIRSTRTFAFRMD